MRDTIDMAREALVVPYIVGPTNAEYLERLKALVALVRADERMSFYGQDKPAKCADGCPPNQICDYCQVVAPVKEMILAEREKAKHNEEVLMNALWKACGDDAQVVEATIESQGELK